jgi:ribonucleoside-triphosphate reductase
MRTAETITREIEDLKTRLANAKGTETEVYTRIVGYYRSLRNWNKGKREEYSQRLPFEAEVCESCVTVAAPVQAAAAPAGAGTLKDIAAYRYFYRKNCPNCPPVRDFISRLPLNGQPVDVDTEAGLSEARVNDVQSTPTVVFYDSEGKARLRGYSVGQLQELFAGAV